MDFNKLFSLEGKVALVTGAAYGIGFAIAEAYAKAGAKIAFNCRSQHHMDQALADYKAKGIEAKGYICDVTDEEQVKNMVADIEKELGVIDILVNNAGIIKRIPMTEMSVDDFKQVIDIDLTAPFIVSKAVIPGMIKKGHGKIINICSMMSELGRETISAYAAAKGGLKMLSTTSSAMAWALVTSQLLRQHLSVSVRLMVAVIHSTALSVQRLLQVAGWNPKSWQVLLFSWLQMLLMQ
jgi:gluconate 5-dehydrogenase